jgi:hypothetical protein
MEKTRQNKNPELSAWRREPKSELETGRIVQHLDLRAVKAGDGGDQAEPEPVARPVAAVFEPVKALEDVLVLVGGNAGPVIGD